MYGYQSSRVQVMSEVKRELESVVWFIGIKGIEVYLSEFKVDTCHRIDRSVVHAREYDVVFGLTHGWTGGVLMGLLNGVRLGTRLF